MTVNSGSPGTEISLQDLQDAYGGSHPISLSEYYRGGVEVPSTAISGNNPYTGQTSASGGGSGSGGGDGIAVNVTNRSTTSGGGTSRISYTGNEGTNNNRPGLSVASNVGSRGDSFAALRVSAQTVFAHLNYSGNLISSRSGYRVSSRDAVVTSGQVNFRGPAWTTSDGNASWPLLSSTGEIYRGWRGGGVSFQRAYVDQRAPQVTTQRRQFVFTNNTGQRISLTTTAMGGNSRTETLNPGGTIDTGTLDGGSEAWTYSYSIVDAGSGSGTGDETNDGVVTDVITNPGGTSFGGLGRPVIRVNVQRPTNVDYVVQPTDSSIQIEGAHPSGAQDERPRGTWQVVRGSSIIFGPTQFSGQSNYSRNFRGPAYQGESLSNQIGSQLRAGDRVQSNDYTLAARVYTRSRSVNTTPTTYDVSFRNDNLETIIMSPGSTGGSRTLTSGQTAQVLDNASSPNWSFQYRFAPSSQPANTAIPESGEVELDQFNTPGNFAG